MAAREEIRLYRSALFDDEIFIHGYPERTGGVSDGLRSTLNLGHRWGDTMENIEENRRRVAKFAGFDYDRLVVTKHVHGTNVWRVGQDLPDPPEFDGLVSDVPGAVLGAFAADCIPLLFADANARICAAAHAGWRGTVGEIACRVVEEMRRAGGSPAATQVALGPSIGPCCFEVGPEVVAAFTEAFPTAEGLVVPKENHKAHIDLRVATRVQLLRAGVLPENIDDTPPCTKCTPERFFSYRRDGQAGGVHMGFIGLR